MNSNEENSSFSVSVSWCKMAKQFLKWQHIHLNSAESFQIAFIKTLPKYKLEK
jgi:hypothetical protein